MNENMDPKMINRKTDDNDEKCIEKLKATTGSKTATFATATTTTAILDTSTTGSNNASNTKRTITSENDSEINNNRTEESVLKRSRVGQEHDAVKSTTIAAPTQAPTVTAVTTSNDKEQKQQQQQNVEVNNDDFDVDNNDGEVLDLACTMNLKAGDRLEVQWEVDMNNTSTDFDDEEDEDGDGDDTTKRDNSENEEAILAASSNNSNDQLLQVRWWGATLLEHDGRTDDNVAIRTLLYDPYPEGGFPEPSKEDVIFMGRDILINYPAQDELNFRIVQSDTAIITTTTNDDDDDDDTITEYVVSTDQDIEDLVDKILTNALQNQSSNFTSLPHAQQIYIAEKIATKKNKLIVLLKEHMKEQRTGAMIRSVTAQDALQLLARAMTED